MPCHREQERRGCRPPGVVLLVGHGTPVRCARLMGARPSSQCRELIKRGSMMLLDKDRSPLRFAVAAAVVSSLTLTVMTTVAGLLWDTHLLTYGVPLWVFAVALPATALAS